LRNLAIRAASESFADSLMVVVGFITLLMI
jgi:hypothetical protein